ncbi:MAG: polysaccharide biosynthesis protein [Butyrivibrio sp.]|nr:polysaccharide biosynthesis protein [Butyrivibrio sp.]
MFDLNAFIDQNVTNRAGSMFAADLQAHEDALRAQIGGKKVCVIGGAGSIGSSFIRALLPYGPAALVVVDTNENGLTELTRDLRSEGMSLPEDYLTYPMDYASPVFERMFLARGGFDIVANFSAHKHVRSEKDIYSVEALLSNNVLHARRLLDLLSKQPPQHFFCVSTDKAANPVNIMGASKRVMEDLIFAYSDRFPVSTARFANVAFSNGSLLDGALKRLSKLQPLVAPTDVERYFVSPEESGQICLMACILGGNREIFFPKLSESQMKGFDEITEALLRAQGYEVCRCPDDASAVRAAQELRAQLAAGKAPEHPAYPVHFFTSDTSGEKAFEEFYTESETLDRDRFASLGVITGKPQPPVDQLQRLITELEVLFAGNQTTKEDIIGLLSDYLPNFAHIETGKSLDMKM